MTWARIKFMWGSNLGMRSVSEIIVLRVSQDWIAITFWSPFRAMLEKRNSTIFKKAF